MAKPSETFGSILGDKAETADALWSTDLEMAHDGFASVARRLGLSGLMAHNLERAMATLLD